MLVFIKYYVVLLKEEHTSPPNTSLWKNSIRDSWRPVTIVAIPKYSNSSIPTKSFRPISLTSRGLKPTKRAVRSHLTSVSVPDDPFHFAYKPNGSTMNAAAFLVHSITKSLDASTHSVRCAFSDFASAFNSVPRSLFLRKQEQFS